MTVHGIGACMLTALMRRDRARDLDSSWLLHGPSDQPLDEAIVDLSEAPLPPAWRYAAE